MNVIGYVRVSTSGQAKDGYSLAYQQDEIRSYVRNKDGTCRTSLRMKESVGQGWMRMILKWTESAFRAC